MATKQARARLGVGLLALALIVAGCGGSSKPSANSTSGAAAEAFDPNAVLRIGYNLQNSSIGELDPIKSATPSNFDLTRYVFGTLLLDKGDGTYEPQLAKSVKVANPQTVDI